MKFKQTDKLYLSERSKISEKYGPQELWSIIDHWPLYCGIANLARFIAILDIIRGVLQVPGHIAEFGLWKGANLLFIAKVMRIFDPHCLKVLHGFDSFQGLTEFTEFDAEANQLEGKYQSSFDELNDFIELYGMSDEIVIHKGLIEETLPKLIKSNPELAFSLVYCDTDLYQSTLLILEELHPRLSQGGVFVLDEWNNENFPGEGVAVNDFLQKYGDYYAQEHIPNTRQPTLLLRKIKVGEQ